MPLHELQSNPSKTKRVGRGGRRGKTAGRGTKGQKARAGGTPRPASRDIIKKIPKLRGHGINRGRTVNPNRVRPYAITISTIVENYEAGETVSAQTLFEKGLLSEGVRSVKIIGEGNLPKNLNFSGVLASKGAREQIEAAGAKFSEQ